ncbi:UDP-glycosyltransferase 73C3 [Linum perenne]
MIVNSFEELDPEYVEMYKVEMGGKAWCVGPVSLVNENQLDRLQRGNEWLDLQESGSVVYVCLGSICNISTSQLIELGLGLEASNRSFMWVIRDANNTNEKEEIEIWISESGFESRVKNRGLLIRGWAPQVLILSHSSRKAEELKALAVAAVGEGGSSFKSVGMLIEDVTKFGGDC